MVPKPIFESQSNFQVVVCSEKEVDECRSICSYPIAFGVTPDNVLVTLNRNEALQRRTGGVSVKI